MTTAAAAAAVLSKLNKYSVLAAGNLARETKAEIKNPFLVFSTATFKLIVTKNKKSSGKN